MCGIVGVLGRINKARLSMFEDMLAMDAVRGVDSTGIAVVNPTGVHTAKDILLPAQLLEDKGYKEAKSHHPLCLIGHNRAATRGVITAKNAHPFTHGHITMVHNGTLDAKWRLPKSWKFDTDSEAIAYNIAELGIETIWPVLEGAATLVWWNAKDNSLNIASNGKRSFFMQPLKGNDGIVWASERWMYQTAALWAGVEFDKPDTVYTPSNDMLYTVRYDANKKTFTFSEKKLEPFKVGNEIAGYKAVEPTNFKKKKKKKKHSGNVIPFKSAAQSAECFMQCKGKYVERAANRDDPYSDEKIRQRYPELFDDPLTDRTDADLDTRAVPFRPEKKKDPIRTAARFHALFDLVALHLKDMTAEVFNTTYDKCLSCDTPFDYNDYFTAKIVGNNKAVCALCQCDLWVESGTTPDQIRVQ